MAELPTTFGKYYLTEKLATGGMAEIYLGKIVGPGGFEKQLVIKQIHPRLSGQRHFVDLFVAEAKTLVTLAHGNIVPVYELGVIEDTYFIAMDYIDGPTLYRFTEALARRAVQLDPAIAAWIMARILEGLDYAHRKGEGVIHRDLSPRNVMLSRDGEVKLVDFGIAVTLGAPGEGEASQSAPTGSFPYMSPEQVRREPLTGQTDLFSLGVLGWEMLTGKRLFTRTDPDETLAAVLGADIPRPSSLRPDLPARLDDLVMRALDRDRAARWPSAGDMLAALQRYLYSLDTPPTPRDLAGLVARTNPPETRRLPTHADALDALAGAAPGDLPPGESTEVTPPPAGPRTAVIPREAGTPRGRSKTARQHSFATNVQLASLLERATPADAASDGPTTTVAPRPAKPTSTPAKPTSTPAKPTSTPAKPTSTPASPASTPASVASPATVAGEDRPAAATLAGPAAAPDTTLRLRAERSSITAGGPPSRAALLAGGLLATGLAIGAVAVFMRNRAAVLEANVDASPYDAPTDTPFGYEPPVAAADAAPDATVVGDAGPGDAVPAAAAAPGDAVPAAAAKVLPRQRDAAPGPREAAPPARDAAVATVDAGRPAGTATLQVGADPWGEILIDGVRRGRTPATLEVSAGRHVIEVVFAGEDPPRTRTFPVDLAAGATQAVVADFTRP